MRDTRAKVDKTWVARVILVAGRRPAGGGSHVVQVARARYPMNSGPKGSGARVVLRRAVRSRPIDLIAEPGHAHAQRADRRRYRHDSRAFSRIHTNAVPEGPTASTSPPTP